MAEAPTENPIALGPFDLLEPVARGGMATVWRARHRAQGVPVAIKIVTSPHGQRSEFERRFADEIRAVAALDHPGVVMVLDHGRVGDEVAHPRIQPGSPWLAMEYCGGGTLAHLKKPLPWSTLHGALLALLDALAHAHAHGVVHRDLKPANVLIAARGDARPGVKLSDFGICWAAALGATDDDGMIVGTPAFMAPEQIRGAWRDLGPWTDLYALGCLAWWLCCGSPPFVGAKPHATLVAHLQQEVPTFHSRVAVPPGLEDWLKRLLEKPFDRRYQLAADAAYALSQLPAGEADGPLVGSAVADRLDDTLTATDKSFGESWRLSLPSPDRPATIGAPTPAPMPDTWRRPVPPPPPLQLVGAGLSMYGLRAVQLAGREAERELLWDQLREVARTGRARVVVLHGAAGTGKSRLVEWLARRASELGAAHTCKAPFSVDKAPGEALQQMGVTYLRTANLPREEVEVRVRSFLARHGSEDAAEIAVLTELLCPAERDSPGVVRLTRPSEYYAGTSNTMFRLSSQRPLITWLDDVQWGLHGLGLALQVVRTQEERPFPCLLVLTMRDEDLAEGSDEARRLRKLLDTPGVLRVPLGPLSSAAHRDLVRGLLGLDDTLAARVEERTAGNPMFAVQLVGSLVQAGTLEIGEGGFTLKAGARPRLPDDLYEVWANQVRRVVAEFAAPAQTFLEIAACLGLEVHRDEWRRACDDPEGHFGDRFRGDEPLRARLVERLLVQRLAVGTLDRWAFVHGMLRESLERTAREAGRWRAHNEACAATLRPKADHPLVAERVGRHLLEAGAPLDALEPLLSGVEYRLSSVGAPLARALLATVEEAFRGLSLAPRDRRWGRLHVVTALTLQDLDPAASLDEVRRAVAHARAHGPADRVVSATLLEARLQIRARRLPEAEQLIASLLSEGVAGPTQTAALHVAQAEIARRRAHHARAAHDLDLALPVLRASPDAGDRAELANALRERGKASEALGEPSEAASYFGEALAVSERLGEGRGAAECLERLGRSRSVAGDYAAAAELLARALSTYEALGSERQSVCRLRLARALVHTDPDRVWLVVLRLEPSFARLEHPARLAASAGLRLLRSALDGDGRALDETLIEAASLAPRAGAGGYAVAWLALLAAEACRVRGDASRAAALSRGAALVFGAIGDQAMAADAATAVSETR